MEQSNVNTNMEKVKLSVYGEPHFRVMVFVHNAHNSIITGKFIALKGIFET